MIGAKVILCALLATAAAAQTGSKSAAKAVGPHVVIETIGPDGWRSRLGPTNVGVMLASEEGRGYWQPQAAPLLAMWRQLAGGEEAFAAARDRVLGFGGSIRLALRFGEERRGDAPTAFALVLQGDGRTDLPELARDLVGLVERGGPGEWRTTELLGEARRTWVRGEQAISAPIVADGRLTVVFGPSADLQAGEALARHLFASKPTIGQPVPGSPALRVSFDVARLIADTGAFGNEAALMKALGFDSLDRIDVTLAAAGPRVQFGLDVSFRGDDRGIFAALMPDGRGVSAIRGLVPGDASTWKVGRFGWRALFDAVVAAFEQDGPFQDEDLREEIRKDIGIDLGDDLFDHMTDELLVVGAPFERYDRAREATWLVAFRLRDTAAFAAGFGKLLGQARPLLSPAETVEVGDVELRRYGNMLRHDVWIATGNGVLVLAGGRDAEEQATGVLRAAAGLDWQADVGRRGFEGVARYLPDGCNGLAQVDLDAVAGMPAEWWFELLRDVVPVLRGSAMTVDEAEERQGRFRALLRKHELTTLRTSTGFDGSRWSYRVFW